MGWGDKGIPMIITVLLVEQNKKKEPFENDSFPKSQWNIFHFDLYLLTAQ